MEWSLQTMGRANCQGFSLNKAPDPDPTGESTHNSHRDTELSNSHQGAPIRQRVMPAQLRLRSDAINLDLKLRKTNTNCLLIGGLTKPSLTVKFLTSSLYFFPEHLAPASRN